MRIQWILSLFDSRHHEALIQKRTTAMKLYYYAPSGHAHRAALFLSLAGIAHERIEVDLSAGRHPGPQFLALYPLWRGAVLRAHGIILPVSVSHLIYAAG